MNPGDEEFLRLWHATQSLIAGFLGAMVRDQRLHEELAQETLISCWRQWADYDRTRPFGAWALGFARICVLRERRASARGRHLIPFDEATLETLTSDWQNECELLNARRAALHQCLHELPEKSRNLLRQIYGLEANGAAPLAPCPRDGAARVRMHRLRAVLRTCISSRLAVHHVAS